MQCSIRVTLITFFSLNSQAGQEIWDAGLTSSRATPQHATRAAAAMPTFIVAVLNIQLFLGN